MSENARLLGLILFLVLSVQAGVAAPTLSSHAIQCNTDTTLSNTDEIVQIIDGTFDLFQFLRNDVGVYADAARFAGPQFHPCSIASVGMGLVSLCIADTLKLIDNAEGLALQTLKAMSGEIAGFSPARNPINGFFRHWIELNTGARAWNSEYSSIDTGILVSGALFCKKYFANNRDIAVMADGLFNTVDWSAAIANADRGELYMTFDEQGRGELKTLPFNEYMIVAWLAKNNPRDNTRARLLWDKHYEQASALPISIYKDIPVLTDSPGNFLSNFVVQFPYYLCHHFTVHQDYLDFLKNAMRADRLWWAETTAPAYVWGTGAGATGFLDSGYHADNFNSNPGTVCSPHIIAGFSPVDSTVADDIINLWTNNLGVYQAPGSTKKFLWRFSVGEPEWRALDVQGVDLSTLIFGLAALPSVLGKEFFEDFNNFDFPDLSDIKGDSTPKNRDFDLGLDVYPNPFNATTTFRYQLATPSDVNITIYNVQGRRIAGHMFSGQNSGVHLFHFDASNLSSGLYVAHVHTHEGDDVRKILLAK